MGFRVGRRWWAAGAVVVAVCVGLGVWFAWPSGKAVPYDPPARSRQYVAFTACLLTGPSGLSDPVAKAVWSGMQSASSATRAQVMYFPAAAGQAETIGSVRPYADALIQQRCNLVLAVGAVEVAAAQAVAGSNTGFHFVLVGGGAAAANVAVVPRSDASGMSVRVASVVKAAVGGGFRPGIVS